MIQGQTYTVHIGNNLDILPTLADNSVDSIVTDPPYELGFMGKKWDSSGIAYSVELWRQCLRVLKPGGHLLSFGGTRTWHRVAVGIEDAGFEVRDSIAWMYGSGFPKSLDVSKAIDKAAGVEREVIGLKPDWVRFRSAEIERFKNGEPSLMNQRNRELAPEFYKTEASAGFNNPDKGAEITAPETPEAKQWEGWGTALKPAFEPIVVARKPLIGTVAENVLTHGTGGLNIDGSRIGIQEGEKFSGGVATTHSEDWGQLCHSNPEWVAKEKERLKETIRKTETLGRWPANLILDEYSAGLLDEQSGISVSKSGGTSGTHPSPMDWGKENSEIPRGGFDDKGGASRFFYCAKASKGDRNEGLDGLETKQTVGGGGLGNPVSGAYGSEKAPGKNFHPTVKPTELMRYLVKLVTPPGGTVLDPFTGSGSTGKAAILEGFRFIGCELTEDYIPIIEGRLKHAELIKAELEAKEDEALF
jgi:site-specific DNA-methyltransferase (adenine-specific)